MPRPVPTHRSFLALGLPALGLVLALVTLFVYSTHWPVSALLAAVLLGTAAGYYIRLRRRMKELGGLIGLPPPRLGQSLEDWTRQFSAAVTRKIAAERALFDSLFDILQDGVLFVDEDNRVLRANTAATAMLAGESGTLVGASLAEGTGQEALLQLAGTIRTTGTLQSAEIYLPSIAGPGHVAGIPLAGTPQLMLVLRDLTHVRRLESAGEEYATNVSHELKTPLTLILGYTETLLSNGEMAPEFRQRSLLTIEHHTKRIIRIIDDLLRLAWLRNEAGTAGISRSLVSVANTVNEAVAICREWARAADIAIETHIPGDLVWHLNSGLIEEAIVNLVKNAILYALVGPIEIRARVLDNGRLELAVADRGPGLKPEDAKRIFDRFYRADKSRARASGGSGLGLPIVQEIVEAHQGTARVETAPGEGCTFILEIPPLPPAPAPVLPPDE